MELATNPHGHLREGLAVHIVEHGRQEQQSAYRPGPDRGALLTHVRRRGAQLGCLSSLDPIPELGNHDHTGASISLRHGMRSPFYLARVPNAMRNVRVSARRPPV